MFCIITHCLEHTLIRKNISHHDTLLIVVADCKIPRYENGQILPGVEYDRQELKLKKPQSVEAFVVRGAPNLLYFILLIFIILCVIILISIIYNHIK